MLNVHGATFPRGWERTCAHLATLGAVKGFENITFEQAITDAQPRCFRSPGIFSVRWTSHQSAWKRCTRGALRTTVGFEPALAVLFTSDIQYYAAIFVGMAKMPAFMKTLLKEIPAARHDSKLLVGFPGKEVGMDSKNPAARVYVLLMSRVLLLIRRQRGAGSMLGAS